MLAFSGFYGRRWQCRWVHCFIMLNKFQKNRTTANNLKFQFWQMLLTSWASLHWKKDDTDRSCFGSTGFYWLDSLPFICCDMLPSTIVISPSKVSGRKRSWVKTKTPPPPPGIPFWKGFLLRGTRLKPQKSIQTALIYFFFVDNIRLKTHFHGWSTYPPPTYPPQK